MLADVMTRQIEEFYASFREQSSIFRQARAGVFTPHQLVSYLAGVEHVTRSTIPSLRLAVREAERRGFMTLGEYYRHKVGDEAGHDKWARDDQALVRKTFDVKGAAVVPASIMELILIHRTAVVEDPRLYLTFLLFTEYFTVLAVPEWVQILGERCRIPAATMTVLTNHAELDREHVVDARREVDELTVDAAKPERFHELLGQTMRLFAAFCDSIGAMNHVGELARSA